MAERLLFVQFNDGIQSGDEVELPPAIEGEGARQTLERKALSHESRGWAVTWNGPDSFSASKEYPANSETSAPERKDRHFRVTEK